MKPIKPVGTIKEEPKINRKERSSMAYKMTVDGTNSRQEFIDMIDSKVKSGKAKDKLAEAIKIAIASLATNKKYTLEYKYFLDGFQLAIKKVYECSGYKALFELRKKTLNSFVDSALAFQSEYSGKTKPVLTATQKKEFSILTKGLVKDWKTERDNITMQNVDDLLQVIRDELICSLEIDPKNVKPIVFPILEIPAESHECVCDKPCKTDRKAK